MKKNDSVLVIAAEGKSAYAIRIPTEPSVITNESEAARALNEVIAAMTGVKLEITSAKLTNESDCEIVIGRTIREPNDLSYLGDEGFLVKSEGKRIFLEGNSEQSIWDAVTYFSRELIGFDPYTMLEVPKKETLEIPAAFFCEFPRNKEVIKLPRRKPAFAYVENGSIDYQTLMEDSSHYMSRIFPESVCFSDERTYGRMLSMCRNACIHGNPLRLIYHNAAPICRCEKCRAAAKEEGTPGAAYYRMADRVGRALAQEYPHRTLRLLAYGDTMKAPKMHLSSNICVYVIGDRLSSSHAINDTSCRVNSAFARNLRAWVKACDEVHVVDFTSDYFYYPIFFPNFDIVRRNVRFYHQIGVKGVHLQWDERQASIEFGPARKIIYDALLSNPRMTDATFDRVMNDALAAAYGSEYVKPLREYIALMTEHCAKEYDIYTRPEVLHPVARRPIDDLCHHEYDLTVMKRAYDLWNGMHPYHEVLSTSRVYLSQMLFSRYQSLPISHAMVQFGEWYVNAIDNMDMSSVEEILFAEK